MKAMILAAGLGTRLAPLTNDIPKCLVSAGGKTMLEHAIAALKAAGVDSVVINTHYKADAVRSFIAAHNLGVAVELSPEDELLDTGGGVFHARHHFVDEESFFIYNADAYCDLDLKQLIDAHAAAHVDATALVMEPRSSRVLLFDGDQIEGWDNGKGMRQTISTVAAPQSWSFGGISLVSPRIFEAMEPLGTKFSLISAFLEMARRGMKVQPLLLRHAYWIDMGTIERLNDLRAHLG